MTQRELAEKVGVSHATICKLENDETAWSTLRDSTDDLIYENLRTLGSWQSDIGSIFKDDVSDIDIREMRKKIRDKRKAMGLSQKELGAMLGIDFTTISHYENHDKNWKNTKSNVAYKLIQFVEGKYDVGEVSVNADKDEIEQTVEEKTVDRIRSNNILHNELPDESKDETVEDVLSGLIDILQDKLATSKTDKKATHVYVGMIGILCDAYLMEM